MDETEVVSSPALQGGTSTPRPEERRASVTHLSLRRFRSRSTRRSSVVQETIVRTKTQGKDYKMVVLHAGQPVQAGIIADFVLVHGLTGDYINTWTVNPGWRRKGGYCWPRDLLPKLYPNLRIMSFSYDADVTHVCGGARVAEGNVVEYANTLLTWLRTLRPDDSLESNRPLIFFGHSLGGLVIERALLIASRKEPNWLFKMYHATVGVYVFGTPHYGSDFASFIVPFAQAIRPFHFVNLHILKDLLPDKIRRRHRRKVEGEGEKKEENTWQRELVDLLLRRKADNDPIRFFCGFEQLGRAGIPGLHRVVHADSAILSDDHSIVDQCGFHVTHTDLIFDARLRSLVLHLSTIDEAFPAPVPKDQPWRVVWRIDLLPTMVKKFIGREELLQDIFKALETWSRNRPAVVVLIANGGYGKSQIALEYARRRFVDRTYDRVFWADASSDQSAKLSFVRIWDTISPNTAGTVDEKFQKACEALRDMSVRWLLILDNFDRSVLDTDEVPDAVVDGQEDEQQSQMSNPSRNGTPDSQTDVRNTYIKKFLPPNDFGHVIITSRDKNVKVLGKTVKVPLMTEDEAILMLKTRLMARLDPNVVKWDEKQAKTIIREIDCLPLALEQIASYIITSRLSLKKFLYSYQHARRDILERVPEESNFRVSRVLEDSSYVKKSLGVLEVWEMSLKAIEEHSNKRIRDIALAMLTTAGFLDRTGISIKFLTKLQVESRGLIHWTTLGRDNITLLELDKAAHLLDSWSVIQGIQHEEDQDLVEKLTVHPLIQDWIRLRMTPSTLYDEALKTIQLIQRNLARDHDELLATSLESKHEIVRHIVAIRSLLETKRPEFEILRRLEFGKGILSEATITFASFFYDLGDLDTATQLFDLVMESHRATHSQEKPDALFLQAEEGLALVHLWKEDGDGAFKLLDDAVRGYRKLPVEYTRPLHRAIHNLGEVECFRKNFDAAIELFQTSLKGLTAEFGRWSKEVYREKEALGNAYRAKGLSDDAFKEVNEAYEGLVRVDPKGDATINATESLALVRKAQGNLAEAERLYHTVIAVYERSVGRNQYTTLGAMGGLADTYRKNGEWGKAAEEYAKIMKRLEETKSTSEAQYTRAKEAYENVTSKQPSRGPPDDFSYPWPRAVAELQTLPAPQSRE